MDAYPDRAVAWFAVGCYYFVIRKLEMARRFFSKATSLDVMFAPAWIGFGHSFAMQVQQKAKKGTIAKREKKNGARDRRLRAMR